MTVTLYDHEPAAGQPQPGGPGTPDPAATVELPVVRHTGGAAGATPPPVFVDSSGRRQRRVRRLGLLLAVPAVGYLALLVSTVLGGPTVSAPFLPLPQPPAATAAPAPDAGDPAPADSGSPAPDAAQPTGARPSAGGHRSAVPVAGATPSAEARPGAPVTPGVPPGQGNGNGNGGTPSAAPSHGHHGPTGKPSHLPWLP
ncbi:hypothetical protein ACFW1A_34205 [Kitasatospora sp. NPDC058965]|uniref:hypothetical protein n=1 Tax=Kitasatospora sp. NPDC058965 TaxID=3346682 RepID=UPI0036877AE7